jgi:hypothetical protein
LGHTEATLLTNLRFADDVLLIAPSLKHVTAMLEDISSAACSRGLELHPDKTKILSNQSVRGGRTTEQNVHINGMSIEILPYSSGTKYLGRLINFADFTQTELDNRISQAWKKFMVFKQELTNKQYSINDRIRLFDSTVSPTFLYGCAAWTLTKQMELKIKRTQRRMLRLVIGHGRRRVQVRTSHASDSSSAEDLSSDLEGDEVLEPWVEWITRVTHEAEARLSKCNIEDWVTLCRRQKWQWGSKVANMSWERWAFQAARWQPSWRVKAKRPPGKPKLRWEDAIKQFLVSQDIQKDWLDVASDVSMWRDMEDAFCRET